MRSPTNTIAEGHIRRMAGRLGSRITDVGITVRAENGNSPERRTPPSATATSPPGIRKAATKQAATPR
jgi:hypothetical protein